MKVLKRYGPYLWIVPTLIILIFVGLFPLLYSLGYSFTNYNLATGKCDFIGVGNYVNILSDSSFWSSLQITLILTVVSVSVTFLLGIGLALLLNTEPKGRKFLYPLLILPMTLTPVAVGLMWKFMYNYDFGIFNYFTNVIGLGRHAWVGSSSTALWSIVIADIWMWTSFVMIIVLAGLTALPKPVYESAKVDGASKWRTFKSVTLPLLTPVLLAVLLLRTIDSFKIFDLVYTLTAGGPATATEVVSLFTYREGFKFFHMGYAMALSWILLIITLIISLIYIKTISRR